MPPEGVRRWAAAHSFQIRLGIALAAVVGAYHYSLLTLVRALSLDTPLAYLGLVPFIALGLGLLRAAPGSNEPALHDREVDFIVGLPLLGSALLVVTLLPHRMSSLFWVWRVDLLSLPFFVAGVVTLVFGVRTTWRLRLPIAFLLLAWPLPWTTLLTRWLDAFTTVTVDVLRQVLTWVPVATPLAGSDGSLFQVKHGTEVFQLSVASSCSGVNGVVGFLLVGVAFSSLVTGRRLTKAVWLLTGMLLIWALNVGRLVLLFWAGSRFGERVAVDGLHPFVGVLLFALGVGAMAATIKPLGLAIPRGDRPRTRSALPYHRAAVPRLGAALVVLLTLVTGVGVADASMRKYQLVAGDLGAARLSSFTAAPAQLPGFAVAATGSYPWSQRFFGADSHWQRYRYSPVAGAAPHVVTADVISTTALQRFGDYGIEACYRFHGFDVSAERSFPLDGGVTGKLLTYTDAKQHLRWTVVYWIWPVKSNGRERFERIALLTPSSTSASSPEPRKDPLRGLQGTGYVPTKTPDTESLDNDPTSRFLTGFAKALVASRAGS